MIRMQGATLAVVLVGLVTVMTSSLVTARIEPEDLFGRIPAEERHGIITTTPATSHRLKTTTPSTGQRLAQFISRELCERWRRQNVKHLPSFCWRFFPKHRPSSPVALEEPTVSPVHRLREEELKYNHMW